MLYYRFSDKLKTVNFYTKIQFPCGLGVQNWPTMTLSGYFPRDRWLGCHDDSANA